MQLCLKAEQPNTDKAGGRDLYTLGYGMSSVLRDMGTMACGGEAQVLWAT